MCKNNCTCSTTFRGSSMPVSRDVRIDKFEGNDVVVYPVVMAIADVVMNESLFPVEEYHPDSWNDVPLTIGHPTQLDGSFLNAKLPKVIEDYAVGRVFNVKIDGNRLIGDAYVDIDKLRELSMDAFISMTHNEKLDVSTGFFCGVEEASGESKGRAYTSICRNVVPNHLALLPGDIGACSWEDGCGVRNKMKFSDAIALLKAENAKKDNMAKKVTPKKHGDVPPGTPTDQTPDRDGIVAALIASSDTPYSEADKEALMSLSDAGFAHIAGSLNAAPPVPPVDPNEPDEDDVPGAPPPPPVPPVKQNSSLSVADREALAFAHKVTGAHKKSLVDKIVATNSALTAKKLEGFSLEQLEMLAETSKPVQPANYSGRGTPMAPKATANAAGAAAMMNGIGVAEHFAKKDK